MIAALAGEAAAVEVEAEIRKGDTSITAVNMAEVIDQLVRAAGRPLQDVESSLASLAAGGMGGVHVDDSIGKLAGVIRAQHYDRRTAAISLADCVALAAASVTNATLATADPPLAALARRIGVKVLPLPDSAGNRP